MITAVDHTLRRQLELTLVEYAILEMVALLGMKKYSYAEVGEMLGVSSGLVSSSVKRLLSIDPQLMIESEGEWFVTGIWRELLSGEQIQLTDDIERLSEDVVSLFNDMFDSHARYQTWSNNINAIYKTYKKMFNKDIGIKQFQAVFEFKKAEWGGTDMAKYLRLSTLLTPNNFIKYLEEARSNYIKTQKK